MTKRPKLTCRACPGTVRQAPAPQRLIKGGIPTLVAHILVIRYADHLLLYRQAQIMARQGVILDRATLAFWMGYAAAEIAPVVARLCEMMLASVRIFVDETVMPVLDPGRGRTKQGYFWAIARDDRPWGGSEPPAVVYSYAPGRGQHAATLLGDYRGILQCDGYSAYKQLAGPNSNEQSLTLVPRATKHRLQLTAASFGKIPTTSLRRYSLCGEIDERVNAFLARPIEGDWQYLWLNATYVKVRRAHLIVSVAVIVVGLNTDGRREVLGMTTGHSEAEPFWVEFLRTLARRGLRGAKLVVSDAHPGLKAAITKVLDVTWQRCRVHFMRNALAYAGKTQRRIVSA